MTDGLQITAISFLKSVEASGEIPLAFGVLVVVLLDAEVLEPLEAPNAPKPLEPLQTKL